MQTRTRNLGIALLLTVMAGVGTIVVLERRPDTTPLLGNTGATLARVTVSDDLATFDMASSEIDRPTMLAPGLDLGQVLRRDGDGPWYSQVIDPDRVDTPYVADTEVCGGSETSLVASGNVGTQLDDVVLLEDIRVAVPTIWRSAGGRRWTRIAVTEAPQPSSLRAIASARAIGFPDRLVAIGEPLSAGGKPYVAVSDDCGSTWRVDVLPDGRGSTFAEAILIDDQGVLIVGRTDATEPYEKSLMVWRATHPDTPLSFEATIVETEASAGAPISFVSRSEEFVIIGLLDSRQRNAALLGWDGAAKSKFTRFGESVSDWKPISIVGSAAGPHLLSLADAGRRFELRRFTIDGAPMDPLPRINGQAFRQTRFVSDGGTRMWIIAEENDFVLRAWSITLLDTASCAEQVDGGGC